ncbi:MAG: hypothetical protein GY749_17275 [Desulfobacteraceae bacterium]|nr:hypothetical protein [Desulfobacteraceae bacterium]
MANNFDKEIEIVQNRLDTASERMKQIRSEFMSETIKYFRVWYEQLTKEKVTAEAELTRELGLNKLSHLKNEVNALKSGTEKIVSEFIDKDGLWWCRNDPVQPSFTEDVDNALRLIAGRLGIILENYGYITTNPEDPSFWREWDKLGLNRPSDARPFYPHYLDLPVHIKDMLEEYEELIREKAEYTYHVKKLKDTKARSEAEALWDRA